MNAHSKCPTVLIEDIPADNDDFNGPHERVASAIADMLLNEAGGKVIGLEGKWGAGKSSVVNFIRKKCTASSDSFKIIQFDAWAHEGDPLRRTYLETAIRYLMACSWGIEEVKWNTTLKKLSERQTSHNRRSFPIVSNLGLIFAISTLFIPFGISVLGAGQTSVIYTNLSTTEHWGRMGLVGLIFTFAPAIVLIGNAARVAIRHLRGGPRSAKVDWQFLASSTFVREKYESVTTSEPTSIEFEDIFADLMQDALKDHPKRKVVFVLDNLDRVEPKTALEIWATLQTFVQEHHQRKNAWFKQIWILVPYDPEGLKKIWQQRKEGKNALLQQNSANEIYESFFDKSFQIRFQVTQPVFSDWKKYLFKLLKVALPHHDRDQHMIYKVYSEFGNGAIKPPTPRQIKVFVNQIGAIHRQWGDDYPLAHVAYFVLKNNADFLSGLRGGGNLDAATRLLGKDLSKNLAGLAFNVDADTGQQYLLTTPILDALTARDDKRLKDLATIHKDGFWTVLENVAPQIQYVSAQQLGFSIVCLKDTGLLETGPKDDVASIKHQLFLSTYNRDDWSSFDAVLADAIATICTWQPEQDFSVHIYGAIRKSLSEYNVTKDNVAPTYDFVLKYLKFLQNEKVLEVIKDSLKLQLEEPDEWFTLCDYLEKETTHKKALASKIGAYPTIKQIEDSLIVRINNGAIEQRLFNTIRITPLTPYNNDWNNLLPTIHSRLASNSALAQAHLLFLMLFEIKRLAKGDAESHLADLVNKGIALHYLYHAQAENNLPVKALMIFCHLKQRNDATMAGSSGNAPNGHSTLIQILDQQDKELAKIFVNNLIEWDNINLIKPLIATLGYKPFFVECLRQIIDLEQFGTFYLAEYLSLNWKDLESKLGADYTRLIEKFVSIPDNYMAVAAQSLKVENTGLYIALTAKKAKGSDQFLASIKMLLEKMSTSDWKEKLEQIPKLYDLILHLKAHDIPLSFDNALADALADQSKLVIRSEKSLPEEIKNQWSSILSTLQTPVRNEMRGNILDIIEESRGKISVPFFEMYKDEIFAFEVLSNRKSIVGEMLSPWLQERNVYWLGWMKEFLKEHPNFIKKCKDKEAAEAFTTRLQRSLTENHNDEAQKLIVEIAGALGIKPPKDSTDQTSDSEAAE